MVCTRRMFLSIMINLPCQLQFRLANLLLLLVVWICMDHSLAQTLFTEAEKNQILYIHKQRLANEALKLFENQYQQEPRNEVFNQMVHYKGLYENLDIESIRFRTMVCDQQLSPLSGFDYKRHNNQHHLACFSNDSFLVHTFRVEPDGQLVFRLPHSGIKHVERGILRQVKLYREYETDRLYMAALIDQGIFQLKIYEVIDGRVVDKELRHKFQFQERPVWIEVLHYDNNKQRIVALVDTPRATKFEVYREGEIVIASAPNAFRLRTMRIQSQALIILSNSTHWSACRYQDSGHEFVNQFQMSSLPIRDLQLFSNGHRYYVGVATENQQYLYQWRERQRFRGVARMPLKRVYRMNTITMSYAREDNFFYFDQVGSDTLLIFGYDITNSAFYQLKNVSKKSLGLPNVAYNPYVGVNFYENNVAYELKLAKSEIHVLIFNTSITHRASPSQTSTLYNLQRYNKEIYERKIAHLKQNIHHLEEKEIISKKAINLKFDFDVEFRAKVKVKRYVTNDPAVPEKLTINERVIDNRDLLVPINYLQNQMGQVLQWIQELNQTINDEVVYKSQSAVIGSFKEFANHVMVGKVYAKHASIGRYRGQDVGQLLSSLYRAGANQPIKSRKTFTGTLLVNRFLNVGKLNHIDPAHFMYATIPQNIYTSLWYRNLATANLVTLDDLSSNVSVSKVVFINQDICSRTFNKGCLNSHPIVIQNKLLFHDLNVDNLYVNKIDKLAISQLPEKVLLRNRPTPQRFKVRTQIPLFYTRSDLFAHHINEHKSDRIFANLVRKHGQIKFMKPVRFHGNVRVNFVNIEGRVNQIRIPEDLVDRHSEQIITGVKRFPQASMTHLNATFLNHLSIPSDIVTLSGDEVILDNVVLDSLNLHSNLHVQGLVDGINLTHLDHRFIDSFKNRFHNITFFKSVNVSSIRVQGPINGLNMDILYKNAFFKNERKIHITSPKRVENNFRCKAIIAETINGVNLDNYVKTFVPAQITGRLVFKALVHFGNIVLHHSIDGVKIHDIFKQVVTLSTFQNLYGNFHFSHIGVTDQFQVYGLIDGVPPSSFMLYSRPQNVTGPRTFSDVHVQRLVSADNLEATVVNQQNFTLLASNLINLKQPFHLKAIVRCMNCSATELFTIDINRRNFTKFTLNYVSKTRPQIIHGNKEFAVSQRFVDVQTQSGVANLDLRYIQKNAITLKGYNIIQKPVVIHGNLVTLKGQLHADFFNNIDINQFRNRVVYRNVTDKIRIQGDIVYLNGFDVQADVNVTKLNEYPPDQLLMTSNRDYIIHSNVNFKNKVIASNNHNINVLGQVNSVNLTGLDRSILKTNHRGEILGNVNFVNNVQTEEIVVHGQVEGIQITRDSVVMRNKEQNIKSMVINGPQLFNQSINILASLNDNHKDNLHKIVLVRTQEDQVINATKTFLRLEANEIHQVNGQVHINVINGINLQKFQATAVFGSEDRTIRMKQRFTNNITVTSPHLRIVGTVNNIKLSDIIRLDVVNQSISGHKIFDNVRFNDDVEVHGHVDTYDLNQVANNLLYTYGNQRVPNHISFKAPIFMMSNNSVNWLNNYRPQDLITLHGRQQINGRIELNNVIADMVYVASKLVSGVNLTEVEQHGFFTDTDQEQVLPGTLVVNNAVFNKDVQLTYHLNNIDLNIAIESTKAKMDQKVDINKVQDKMKAYSTTLYNHIIQYENANFEIDYFYSSNVSYGQMFGKLLPNSTIKLLKLRSNFYHYPQQIINIPSSANLLEESLSSQLHQRPNSTIDFFWLADKLFQIEIYQDFVRHVTSLQLSFFLDNMRRVRVFEQSLALTMKPLIFTMDNRVYVLYTVNHTADTCHSTSLDSPQTHLSLLDIDFSDLSVSQKTVQNFPEESVTNVGHYSDEVGFHYVVFNVYRSEIESHLTIYIRYLPGCQFKHFQTISAPKVQKLALFKFGTINMLEQYIATLNATHLNIWKQNGISGFVTYWSIPTSSRSSLDNNQSSEIFPLVYQGNRLIIYAPTCPIDIFEAQLNGMFSSLQLVYDDYL